MPEDFYVTEVILGNEKFFVISSIDGITVSSLLLDVNSNVDIETVEQVDQIIKAFDPEAVVKGSDVFQKVVL